MPKANPWGSPAPGSGPSSVDETAGASLADIMSEQLADELHADDARLAANKEAYAGATGDPPVEEDPTTCDETSSDYMLALMLQRQFAREHDDELRAQERSINKQDKVAVSYQKYNLVHDQEDEDSSETDDEDLRQIQLDKRYNPTLPVFSGSSGLCIHEGERVSKHDKVISGRRNAGKVLQFPPEFPTGDAAGIDMQLSNQVYNTLKRHSAVEQRRRARLRDKTDTATAELALDAKTKLVIFKMLDGGLLESVTGQVATGKESTVLHATGGFMEERPVPKECALKVYKTTLNEFKNRAEYVRDDYRFKNPRKVLKVWAEKELANLNRMCRAGIRCPTPVRLKKHVLVMSFIGADARPAPRLKEVDLEHQQWCDAYRQCIKMMQDMYEVCHLVHGDLSEFNILYHREQCWFIDVSQSVDLSHPRSLLFLLNDCRNLTSFFTRHMLPEDGLLTVAELFTQLTDIQIENTDAIQAEVEHFVAENRNVQLRIDKKKPGDCELRKYFADVDANVCA